MKKIKLLIGLSAMMAIGSCTVEKRRYTDGYHVDWHKNKGKGVQAESKNLEIQSSPSSTEMTAGFEENSSNGVQSNTARIEKEVETINNDIPNSTVTKNVGTKRSGKINEAKQDRAFQNKNLLFKDFNRANVQTFSAQPLDSSSETDIVLLVILAIFIPPLAVYLYEGSWTQRCTINLILTLLCGIPGIIHALIVILGNK